MSRVLIGEDQEKIFLYFLFIQKYYFDRSHDSNFFVAGSRDTTVRLFSLMYIKGSYSLILILQYVIIFKLFLLFRFCCTDIVGAS